MSDEKDARIARAMREYETAKLATETVAKITTTLTWMYAAPVIGVGLGALVMMVILLVQMWPE